MGKPGRIGREMDQFRRNVEVFERAVIPHRDGETADELLEAARSLVPYPDNEMRTVVVHGWATARVSGSAAPGPAPARMYRRRRASGL